MTTSTPVEYDADADCRAARRVRRKLERLNAQMAAALDERAEISTRLRTKGKLSVPQIADLFGVSHAAIHATMRVRRDG